MMRAALVLAASLLTAPAFASSATVPLGPGTLTYEDTHMLADIVSTGGLMVVCIDTACEQLPAAYLRTTSDARATCAALRPDDRPLTVAPGTPLPFAAASKRSACAAHDNPVLYACAIKDGVRYEAVTSITPGCNTEPEMPEASFIEILQGIGVK